MNVNQAAAYTVSTLALATGAMAFATILAQTTTATVALGVLTVLGSALSASSISAWAFLRERVFETSDKEYFEKVFSHLGIAVAAVSQFIAQSVVLAGVTGMAQGVAQGVTAGIAFSVSQAIAELISIKN